MKQLLKKYNGFILLSLALILLAGGLYTLLKTFPEEAQVIAGPRSTLLFEEKIEPGMDDYILQADYALAQVMQRLNKPVSNIIIAESFLQEQGDALYQYKVLYIQHCADYYVFAQALQASLLAWSERAELKTDSQQSNAIYNIFIQGIKTHEIHLLAGAYAGVTPDVNQGDVAEHVEQGSVMPALEITPKGPKLVVVIDDVGESMSKVKRLNNLNFPVTFAIWPYASHTKQADKAAYDHGQEIILHQPMQPIKYPEVNPGKGALLIGMANDEMLERLENNLKRVPHAIGFNNHMGSAMTQNEPTMRVLATMAKKKGLLTLDSLTHPRSRFAGAALKEGAVIYRRDIFLDVVQERRYVLGQLRKAERLARLNGQSIVIGHPYDATLAALEEWQYSRDKGVQIVRLRNLAPLGAKR